MLRYRVLTALWFVPLFLVVLYLGHWTFGAFLALAGILGAVELSRLVRAGGYQPSLPVMGGLLLVLLAGVYIQPGLTAPAVALALILSLLEYAFRAAPNRDALGGWGLSLAGAAYLALPLQHFALLREGANGLLWAGWALAGTWACDTGAYFVGKALGRHKLYPRLSPGKTWEGTAGGVLLAGVVGGLAAAYLGLTWPAGVILGLLTGLAAIMGDLAESFLKRAAGIKDSGGLLPGHCGVLDRLDSLLFVAVVVYYARIIIAPA